MTHVGSGNNPIPKGVTLRVNGQTSHTYKSSGGAQRTVNFSNNGSLFHEIKRSRLQQSLNNKNIEVKNTNNNKNSVSQTSSSMSGGEIASAITTGLMGLLGLAPAIAGLKGAGTKASDAVISGAKSSVGDEASIVSSPALKGMQGADTITGLRDAIRTANSRMNELASCMDSNSEVSKAYESNKQRKTDLGKAIDQKTKTKADLTQQVNTGKENIENKKNMVKNLEAQLRQKNTAYNEVSEVVNFYTDQVAELENSLTNISSELSNANAEKARIQQAGGDTTAIDAKINQLKQQKTSVQAQKADAELHLSQQKEALSTLLCEIQENKDECGKIASDLENEQSRLEQMEENLKTAEKDLKAASDELKELEDEMKTITEQMKTYENNQKEYKALESEIKNQQARLDEMVKQEEEGAEKLQGKNNFAQSHLDSRQARNGNQVGQQGAEAEWQGHLNDKVNERQQRIDAAFNNLGLNTMQDGERVTLDGINYTKHSDGNNVYFTADGDLHTRYNVDNMKARFVAKDSKQYGQDANGTYHKIVDDSFAKSKITSTPSIQNVEGHTSTIQNSQTKIDNLKQRIQSANIDIQNFEMRKTELERQYPSLKNPSNTFVAQPSAQIIQEYNSLPGKIAEANDQIAAFNREIRTLGSQSLE